MLKSTIIILLLCVVTFSCKSSKRAKVVTKKQKQVEHTEHPEHNTSEASTANYVLAENIIQNAKQFEGVRYKYGGTTKKGMDCSGLIYTAFNKENIAVPRTTNLMSTNGDWIDLKQVQRGDLLFFATKKNSRTVNHVGLVVNANPVQFIHSSTSKGVIISSLKERYWYFAFVQARRVL